MAPRNRPRGDQPMSQWVAITVLGRDRPGIVAGVTKALYEHGCNLEDSSATRLRDSFAMILIAMLPDPPRIALLRAELDALAEELGVALDLRDLGHEPPSPEPPGERFVLTVYGADRPGIVYRVSERLAGSSCNVTDVTTRVIGEPSQPIYVMMLEMTAPAGVDASLLESCLQPLRESLGVDITLRVVEEETL